MTQPMLYTYEIVTTMEASSKDNHTIVDLGSQLKTRTAQLVGSSQGQTFTALDTEVGNWLNRPDTGAIATTAKTDAVTRAARESYERVMAADNHVSRMFG